MRRSEQPEAGDHGTAYRRHRLRTAGLQFKKPPSLGSTSTVRPFQSTTQPPVPSVYVTRLPCLFIL